VGDREGEVQREIRHAVQQAGPQIKKSRERERVTERGKYRERSDMLYSKQALKFKNPERESDREGEVQREIRHAVQQAGPQIQKSRQREIERE